MSEVPPRNGPVEFEPRPGWAGHLPGSAEFGRRECTAHGPNLSTAAFVPYRRKSVLLDAGVARYAAVWCTRGLP
jgi:hypothetical protein